MKDTGKIALLFVIFAYLALYCWAKETIAAAIGWRGYASWYGEAYKGKAMANGHPFNPDAMTCASWFYPLGTRLRVRHLNREVIVTVTDRGPDQERVDQNVIIDLSKAAFNALGNLEEGLLWVSVNKIEPEAKKP